MLHDGMLQVTMVPGQGGVTAVSSPEVLAVPWWADGSGLYELGVVCERTVGHLTPPPPRVG